MSFTPKHLYGLKHFIQYKIIPAAILALAFLPGIAFAQRATLTDDAFTSPDCTTQAENKNGKGANLIVAGPLNSERSGVTCTGYLKFSFTSSLPTEITANQIAKATLRLYVSKNHVNSSF